MKYIFVIVLLLSFSFNTSSQQIGDDALKVKLIVEGEIEQYYSSQGYHSISERSNVVWSNGSIEQVVLQKENVPDISLQRPISFNINFVMRNGKLYKILKQYYDVSLSEIRTALRSAKQWNIIDKDYFFTLDYETYMVLYIGDTGLATVETKRTSLNDFPPYLRSIVKNDLEQSKRNKIEKEKKQIIMTNEEKDTDYKYKNTWYDLLEFNKDYYYDVKNKFKKFLLDRFSKNFETSFNDLVQEPRFKGSVEVNNIYSVSLKKVDLSRKAVRNGNIIIAGSDDISTTREFHLIKGSDRECRFLRGFNIDLPFLENNGKKLLSKANFDSIDVYFVKGVTIIKATKKGILYKVYEPQNEQLKAKIQEIAKDKKGNLIVRYEFGNIMGQKIEIIQMEVSNHNNSGYLYSDF